MHNEFLGVVKQNDNYKIGHFSVLRKNYLIVAGTPFFTRECGYW